MFMLNIAIVFQARQQKPGTMFGDKCTAPGKQYNCLYVDHSIDHECGTIQYAQIHGRQQEQRLWTDAANKEREREREVQRKEIIITVVCCIIVYERRIRNTVAQQ